jgi:thiamine biosynthesis lipoprotein
MVEAGGDCQLVGPGPEGAGWRVGMEDPSGRSDPLVVFELTDLACATSSVRVRRWTVGDRQVHHLIDPRTGASGGDGLVAVTVLDPDPAWAEVWSKTLFLSGAARIGAAAECRGLAAVWVEADGRVTTTAPADALVLWRASHV